MAQPTGKSAISRQEYRRYSVRAGSWVVQVEDLPLMTMSYANSFSSLCAQRFIFVKLGRKHGARCRFRTCDPLRVKQVLYH